MAFEPVPRNFALLNENVEINGFARQVMTRQCGIGSSSGRATLSLSGWNGGGHSIVGEGRESLRRRAGEIEIEIATLPDMLSRADRKPSDVGLVWIDVEGGERDVLRGMPEILQLGTPIVIEHLPELITVDAAKEVRDILAGYYMTFCRLGDREVGLRPVEAFDALRMSGDFLFFGRRTAHD
jgi:FkbM family methyltransferase